MARVGFIGVRQYGQHVKNFQAVPRSDEITDLGARRDGLLHRIRELREEPWQCQFQAHVFVASRKHGRMTAWTSGCGQALT